MAEQQPALASGQFKIGGDLPVNRLGFGAMRITGKGIWGDPTDPAAARDTLARVPELGITLIDTADSYGPYVSEDLIRQALHPYRGLVIATKEIGRAPVCTPVTNATIVSRLLLAKQK